MEVRQRQQKPSKNKVEYGGQNGLKPGQVPQERQPANKPEQHERKVRRSQDEQREAKPLARTMSSPEHRDKDPELRGQDGKL